MAILFSFLIGFFCGLRSLTPPAVTAWAVHFGLLKPEHPFSWLGSWPSVIIFTVLALGELVADKLARTPPRTSPPGLIARIVMGGLTGACIAASTGNANLLGAVLGIAGAVAGTFAGFKLRTGIVKALQIPDLPVALVEDLIAIGGSLLIVAPF
ncbi:DUF4126 family protein [bacterium]|nr:DUF4126 family protein [bacterium]